MDKSIEKLKETSIFLRKAVNKNRFDVIIIILIIIITFALRVFWLNQFPPNITGDEAGDLSSVYQIIFDKTVHSFTFFGDGSIPAIIFYPVVFLIKIFGISNSLFSLRLHIAIYSILSLIPFYLILKRYTKSIAISALFTLALSSNYVYLNFSRTAWINMTIIFTGLFLFLFMEKALKDNRMLNYILAGLFAGLSLYGYHYGKILVFAISCFLILRLIKKNRYRDYSKNLIMFFVTMLLVAAPLIIAVSLDHGKSILGRPKAIYAFSNNSDISSKATQALLRHQIEYTFKGFIFLDGKVMSDGIENMRYVPFLTPPVNLLIKVLFIISVIYFLIFDRKNYLLWIVSSTILLTQILSASPPNYSRGIFYIPFIYLISAMFIGEMSRFSMLKTKKIFIYLLLFALIIPTSLSDINFYFKWMSDPLLKSARFPSLEYNELKFWQSIQLARIKSGSSPIRTYQEWELIKNQSK